MRKANKARSAIGVLIIIGATIFYSGLAHLSGPGNKHGALVNVTNNTPEAHTLIAVIVTATFALLTVPLVSLALVLCARRGARLATLYQLRWPLISIATLVGFTAAAVRLLDLAAQLISHATKHANLLITIGGTTFTSILAFIVLVWFFKALWLVGTGLFRADDGHPLLAPIPPSWWYGQQRSSWQLRVPEGSAESLIPSVC